MSRVWKWVLGILAVLVIVAIIAGGVWFLQTRGQMMTSYRPNAVQPNAQGAPSAPNGQNFPNGPRGYGDDGRYPMMGGWGFRGPMMGGRGRFMPFFGPLGMGLFFFGGLLRLLIPLVILVAVAFIFYQLGRRAAAPPAPRPEPTPATSSDQNPPQS